VPSLLRHVALSASALTLALALAGCASTHGISAQSHPLAASQIDTGAALHEAAQDAAWPADGWWQAWQDPQLDHLLALARQDSPSLAAAAARVRQAAALAQQAHAATLPQLGLDASIAREHWPDNYFYGPGLLGNANTWNNTATLDLSYDLDLFGRHDDLAQRGLDEAHAAAADRRAAELNLETTVIRTYVDFALSYALRDSLNAILAEQNHILDIATQRLQGGLGTQLEVSQAEAPLPETRRQLEVLAEHNALLRNQLALLCGQGPGGGDALQRPVLSTQVQNGMTVALPPNLSFDLLGHRPDVVARRWRVQGQAHGIAAARAAFYPNVSLSLAAGGFAAAGGAVGGGLLTFLAAKSLSYSAGPALSLPIFDGGRLRAQLGDAAAGYDLAVAQYDQGVLEAFKQVSDQIVTLNSLARQQTDIEQSLDTARKSDHIATEAFRRGLTDYLNVLNAQARLLTQQQLQQRLLASRLDAYATLMGALGGGLPPQPASEARGDLPAAAPR